MTAYWVILLAVLVVAAVILLIALNRPGNSKTDSTRSTSSEPERYPDPKPPEGPGLKKPPEGPGIKKPPEGPGIKKPPEGPGIKKPPEGSGGKGPTGGSGTVPPKPPVVKPRTVVYEYVPTRYTVRCRTCDGENIRGANMCSICGSYLKY